MSVALYRCSSQVSYTDVMSDVMSDVMKDVLSDIMSDVISNVMSVVMLDVMSLLSVTSNAGPGFNFGISPDRSQSGSHYSWYYDETFCLRLFHWANLVVHSFGSFCWAILVCHFGGPFWWALLVGPFGGQFQWNILGQSDQSFKPNRTGQ